MTTQLIIGDSLCCVPVVFMKKSTLLAFVLWLSADGKTHEASGLPDATFGVPGALDIGSTFRVDGVALADLLGDSTYSDYFPTNVVVRQNDSRKWVVAKAGKVVLAKDGTVDVKKPMENPSGLKLTYTAKNGAFKGSFNAYVNVNGKPKAMSFTLTGVMINGVGYGQAVNKKYGTVLVEIR